MYEKAYALLEEIAAENNVTIIEAASAFKAIPEKYKFFQSDCLHLTREGNEYLADLVAREILKGTR